MPFPEAIRGSAIDLLIANRPAAYLAFDRSLTLQACGGDLATFGLADLCQVENPLQVAYFLEGLLPVESGTFSLAQVQITSGNFADIHIVAEGDTNWVVLIDATREVEERALIEQALRSAEIRLRRAERLEIVGRLAGGVAHDFNNLLTVIRGYAELSLLRAHPDAVHGLLEIRKASDRAALITRQLLTFSKRHVLQIESVQLNDLIQHSREMLRRLLGEDIDIHLKLSPDLSVVRADRGQIEQVLLNLSVNARDAMPTGGRLTIETIPTPKSDPYGVAGVFLRVTDSGIGMSAETKGRVFEPFYTTKADPAGTGLGLSTVHTIVTDAGGFINVESEAGVGTIFTVFLPSGAAIADEAGTIPEEADTPGNGETILVVEDDEDVYALMRDFLSETGYKVLLSQSPGEALEMATTDPGPVDLLLTDVVMPEMSGLQLAEQMRAIRRNLPVVFTSGYAHDVLQQKSLGEHMGSVLRKPFSRAGLLTAIRTALASRATELLKRGVTESSS